MSIKDLLLLSLGCILSSNYVLVRFFGVEDLLSFEKRTIERNMKTSLLLSVTLILSSLLLYPVEKLLLSGAGSALRLILYVVVILLIEVIVMKTAKEENPVSLTAASAVLGPVLFFESGEYTFLEVVFSSIGAGLGYLLAALALSAVREKINDKYVPSLLRGTPILFIALSIISLTVYCF